MRAVVHKAPIRRTLLSIDVGGEMPTPLLNDAFELRDLNVKRVVCRSFEFAF